MISKLSPIAIALALLAAGATVVANGHDGAMGVVKERMDRMESIGKAMKALRGQVRENPPNFAALGENVTVIQGAAEGIADLFPEGSGGEPSEALPSVWEDWEGFVAAAEAMQTAADEFAAVIEAEDVIEVGDAYGNLGKTCKGCHTDYRMKDD
ncbi:cytochrome c [Gammaproteobacteria bacterium]|nr:cytochrome c [Gammaproteobacteria bacterium]